MIGRAAPFLFVLLWSSSFIASKTGLRQMSPLLFVAIRLAACATVLVVGHAAFDSASRFEGLVLAFAGVLALVCGTLYFGRFCRGVPLLPGATAQFLSAAAVSALGALLFESPRADWTNGAIAAIAWN